MATGSPFTVALNRLGPSWQQIPYPGRVDSATVGTEVAGGLGSDQSTGIYFSEYSLVKR
jgi:hypothetical protein